MIEQALKVQRIDESALDRAGILNRFEREVPAYPGYPQRFAVPSHKRSWSVEYPDYAPPEYESPKLLASDRTKIPGYQAERDHAREEFLPLSVSGQMHSFEGPVRVDPETGRPLNPLGRVGISGRGVLDSWGPNHKTETLLTRRSADTGLLEVLLIQRENGEWAIPGEFGEAVEDSLVAAQRTVAEEAGIIVDDVRARLVYQGIADDPCVTDNAWIETVLYHFDFAEGTSGAAQSLIAQKGARDAKWFVFTPEILQELSGNHRDLLGMALSQLLELRQDLSETVRDQLEVIPHVPLLTSFSELRGRIGIFGGSFDPVHSAHLDIARQLKEQHHLDAVVFIPASQNPLKENQTSADARSRVTMLESALWGERGMYVSPIQTRSAGRSYTMELIDTIRKELPREQAELFWIMGADCVRQLPRWRNAERLIDEVAIIPCSRVGHADPRNDSDAMRELSESFGAERAKQLLENFTSLSLPQVSSTAIREALNRGELPQHLTPRVEQLIRKYRLYERGEALARSLGNRGN